MTEYRERLVDPLLAELLAGLPALSLVGPRASGKATTARRHARTVVRLDSPAEAFSVGADPDTVLASLEEPILLDEWQEVPQVLGAVKRAVDDDPRPGRFILTGSIRAETQTATWPGTGRITRIAMYPMTAGEQLTAPETPLVDRIAAGELQSLKPQLHAETSLNLRGYLDLALRGGFPQVALDLSARRRRRWLETYVDEIVTRDTEAAGGGYDSARLARYFEAYALNSGGVAADSTLHEAAAIDRRTGQRYLDLLTRLYVVDELPAWTSNRLKRLSLAPKRFLVDAALLAAATGATTSAVLRDGNLLGRLMETFVVAQLRAQAEISDNRCRLYHLRQREGRHEIDVVAELNARQLMAFEIKATSAPCATDAKHLAWLRDQTDDQFLAGIVLHTGPVAFSLGDRLWALPISTLWQPLPEKGAIPPRAV